MAMQRLNTVLQMCGVVTVLGLTSLALPLPAHARVNISMGIGVPAPVVVTPAPVLVVPAPVVVAPPPVVVDGGYYGYVQRRLSEIRQAPTSAGDIITTTGPLVCCVESGVHDSRKDAADRHQVSRSCPPPSRWSTVRGTHNAARFAGILSWPSCLRDGRWTSAVDPLHHRKAVLDSTLTARGYSALHKRMSARGGLDRFTALLALPVQG
jgi:hypothetical protein